jgi:hypothetical protein
MNGYLLMVGWLMDQLGDFGDVTRRLIVLSFFGEGTGIGLDRGFGAGGFNFDTDSYLLAC